jgi:hypothetical protein
MTEIQINFQTRTNYTPGELESLLGAFEDFVAEFGDDDAISNSFEVKEVSEEGEKKYTMQEFRELVRSGGKDVRIQLFLGDEGESITIDVANEAEEDIDA